MKPVRKVVFPVNGLGTRFLPATKAMPKEMLPVVDMPLIQYAVAEAAAAGITEMIFVTGRNKRAIEDHFDSYPELERELEEKGKDELLELVRGIVEKPDPKVAPSRMAVIGRYVFEPEVFDYLEKVTVGVGGEIQLTDGIASSLDTVPTYAHRFEGTRFDCGSKQGFLDATIHFARKRGFKIN